MRHLAFAAAVCGTLVLAACSDQSRSPTEPAVPPPAENFGNTCTHGRYPFASVAALIPAAFPPSVLNYRALRAEALVRVAGIAILWDFCQDRLARLSALKAIVWIDSKVTSTAADILKAAILNGLGGASTSSVDYIAGVWKTGETKVFTTPSGRATIEVRPGAFSEATLITIRRLPDYPVSFLQDFPLNRQDSPNWDYDATNSHTDNTLATHKVGVVNGVVVYPGTVTMAFCYKSDGEGGHVTYPLPGARIGHNPVGGGFELVEYEPIPANLQAALTDCSFEIGLNPASDRDGLSLASVTWSNAGHYLAKLARTLFLPAPLRAATVGHIGPIAGKPVSLSQFAIVLPDCGEGSYFCLDPDWNPHPYGP